MTIEELYNMYVELKDKFRRHKHDNIESFVLDDGITTVPMSFETAEQTTTKIYFPFAVKILKIRATVVKAIAASDNGTIQGANSIGDSTGGLITATASDSLNTEYATTAITTNYTVGQGSYYKLTSAKTTAGGKLLATLEWVRI